jgi:OOP family OmpA-OmpF porin
MQRLALKLGTLTAVGLLGACGDPQLQSLPRNIADSFSAPGVMEAARAAQPSGTFATAAYTDLMKHAEYENAPMQDYKDAMYHAEKARAVASGQSVTPQNPSERTLPADSVGEVQDGYTRLNAVWSEGMTEDPEALGVALGSFDCWIEQLEENFQPADIAACRDAFFAALDRLEKEEEEMAEMMALSSDVYFDFDMSTIKPEGAAELDKVADLLVKDTTTNVLVWGFTDTAGPAAYNQGLSERRAEAVAAYLEAKGVSRNRMSVEGFGETKLAVETPDNTPNALNRRVELRRR